MLVLEGSNNVRSSVLILLVIKRVTVKKLILDLYCPGAGKKMNKPTNRDAAKE